MYKTNATDMSLRLRQGYNEIKNELVRTVSYGNYAAMRMSIYAITFPLTEFGVLWFLEYTRA